MTNKKLAEKIMEVWYYLGTDADDLGIECEQDLIELLENGGRPIDELLDSFEALVLTFETGDSLINECYIIMEGLIAIS